MAAIPQKCHSCKKEQAVTYLKTDGRFLCKNCFSDWVLATVRKTIKEKNMFERDDRIIIGLSGGKDSSVLLDVLTKIEKNYPSKIIAVCIDEGIKGYRDDGLPIARENAKKLDVEYHEFSFKELFGYTLDEIVNRSRELQNIITTNKKTKLIYHGPCSYCGVFRRKALNLAARKLEGDKVATGHNLSDVSQTILMNLLRGDSFKLLRGDLKPVKMHQLFVPRVKPLQAVAEREIVLYAYYNDVQFHTTECPYSIEAMRLDVRNFLTELEEKYPGTQKSIKNGMEAVSNSYFSALPDIEQQKEEMEEQIQLCKICSEPSSSEICKGCQMLEALFKEHD
ncbi:MAG: TIGR00269 family protein [Asgard group archaeon]|nr:TIGR00269 family protein [Asgard group archaeon]